MIIGKGLIASIFSKDFLIDDCNIIFASGVSNSTENDNNNFERERKMLLECINQHPSKKIIYFSSIFVGYINNSYYIHKKQMENIILEKCKNFLIIRLPQVIGHKGNPKNIINFFKDSIKNEININLFKNSWRAIIDVEDVLSVSKILIQNYKNKIITFSNIEVVSVMDLYEKIVYILGKEKKYEIIDNQENIPIIQNSYEVTETLDQLKICSKNYTNKILNKYSKEW